MSSLFITAIANILSVCTIAICFVSKIPQIQTVLANQSAKGLSLHCKCFVIIHIRLTICSFAVGLSVAAVSLEVLRYAIMWTYNCCFGYSSLSYLEYPILLLQQSILLYFVLKFNERLNVQTVLFGSLMVITMTLFMMTEMLPRTILTFLIVSDCLRLS